MTTPLSQEALYGPLLTNEQQYRVDLHALLSTLELPQEEDPLLEHARHGDAHARDTVIASVFQRVERYARRYAQTYSWTSHRLEYLELVQEGNLAVLESVDRALATDHATAYLTLVACRAIRHYSKRFCSLIVTPSTYGVDPLYTESLDQPLDDESESKTVLDLIGEQFVEDNSTPDATKDPAIFEPLYEAIEQHLSPTQRFVIINHYGLYEKAARPLTELNQELGKGQAHKTRAHAINKLYVCLSDAYQAYVGTLPSAQRTPTMREERALTPEQERRLDCAYAALQQRGQKITSRTLRQEAQMNLLPVRTYLARLRTENPEPTKQERLDRAYAQMEARGEKITMEKLMKVAHVCMASASAYLHSKRGTTPVTFSTRPMEERLEEACEVIQAQGGPITAERVAREARTSHHAVRAYLYERKAAQRDLETAS